MFGTGPASPTQRKGLYYEKLASKFLRKHGLKIQHRNFHCRYGEIDLILLEEKTLVFVEVRYRANAKFGGGHETVDWRKQRKLIKCAQFYLIQQNLYGKCETRFDIVSIEPSQAADQINWIKNAITL